ncbi:extracellular solute-binding protein [Solwaraspora sp. WMMD406]|uniref:extracellular solute-binding protein n=1 Tax=Solwaraspora sp. WMMD406 TaxID=3016095 RepID=UPI002416AA20|nr:extracellular solute-binding protein [Solwaraspora sp. WMMD406]MDG4764006.1 extracellular solute-binding protein [Solwaraspora sp. WMMD406]
MSEPYSRRSFLSGVLATGTLSAVAIYLGGGRALPDVELRLVTGQDGTGARDLLIAIWNEANPRTTVRAEVIPSGSGDERQVMLESAVRGEADVVNLDIIDVPEFAAAELITPVSPGGSQLIDPLDAISRVPGESGTYWAVPFNTDVGMLFTRTVDEASEPPEGLADLLTTVPDGSRQFVGQLRPTVSTFFEGFVVNVIEHAVAQRPGVLAPVGDTAVVAESDRVSRDVELWRSALTPLKEAIATGRILTAGSEAESLAQFVAPGSPGRYMRNWPVRYRELQQLDNPDVRAGRIRVDPLDVGVLGGQSLAVVASSPHAERARDFITFATGDVAQRILAAHGLPPTAIIAYNDVNLRASIPHLMNVRAAVERALPRPAHPNYRAFSNVVKNHVERFLYNDENLSDRFIEEISTALT